MFHKDFLLLLPVPLNHSILFASSILVIVMLVSLIFLLMLFLVLFL